MGRRSQAYQDRSIVKIRRKKKVSLLTFEDVLRVAAGNRELLKEYDRLTGSNLSLKGTPIELAIDDQTGRTTEEFRKFASFVLEHIWLTVLEDQFCG